MYAILINNQLITPGYNGKQFVASVDGPGSYQVRTCTQRGDVIEFGTGVVEVTVRDLFFADTFLFSGWSLPVENHKVDVLCSINKASVCDFCEKVFQFDSETCRETDTGDLCSECTDLYNSELDNEIAWQNVN